MSRPSPASSARLELTFDKPYLLGSLFGEYDQNLVAIENRLGVYIAARGQKLQIEGEAEAAARARDILNGLYNRLVVGQPIDVGAVEAVIAMSAEPTLEGIVRHDVSEPPKVMIRTRKKTIVPRSANQGLYMEALARNELIFALGPAGTGKTYLAVAQAVSQLITGSVDRLILSRPAVEAGEKLGFLPGDMKEKVDPYLPPALRRAERYAFRPTRSSGASPAVRSRLHPSPSCVAARWRTPSSFWTRRRTPPSRR